MAKMQRSIGAEKNDRFLITVSAETGKQIRKLADRMNVSYSKFCGEIIEARLDELEAEDNLND